MRVQLRFARTTALTLLAGLVCFQEAFATDHGVQPLVSLPPGSTLPVTLAQKLDARHVHVGEAVVARLSQRVPLPGDTYLRQKTEILGIPDAAIHQVASWR